MINLIVKRAKELYDNSKSKKGSAKKDEFREISFSNEKADKNSNLTSENSNRGNECIFKIIMTHEEYKNLIQLRHKYKGW